MAWPPRSRLASTRRRSKSCGRIWPCSRLILTLRPDYFVCVGPRVCDYSAVDLDQVMLLMDLDIMDREPDEDIIVVASVNDVR